MATSVALSPHFKGFIREQINSGRYNNVSEVIRAGLRMLEEHEQAQKLAELRAAVSAGIESGEGLAASEVFGELKNKYQRMNANGQE
ncbi:addiction module antitoxin [Photorhabdus temperata]|uniref:Antitoxin ParD n=2 Tax=Photorhabdus khanii TaxID=1004150 RepID=W3V6T0_9GAMM|nr:type II toxin-antitoxin system ParD family antitoxin [Photorhabdus khanii]ETS31641.1 putative addiction module antidote protein, CC2985 family [Photorhabdus khanii NC19]MQL49152.1 type II toxin-antitoxin system ParD family antitoxin [Photorhabdus khanii]OHV58844.1 addiction module antitoxin [Photorhabdus temperata]